MKILTQTGLTELITKVKEADNKKVNTPENGTIVSGGTSKPVNDSDYQKIQSGATTNDFAVFNTNGQVVDSGLDQSDFMVADAEAAKKLVDASVKAPDNKTTELVANKTTILSSSSTDTEYPSAKCVYDFYTTISGYDATKTQTLKHINGTLTWVDD